MDNQSTMDENTLGEILYKIVSGQANEEEHQIYEQWAKTSPELASRLSNDTTLEAIQIRLREIYTMDEQAIRSKIIRFQSQWRRRFHPIILQSKVRRMYAAAAVLVGLFVGVLAVHRQKVELPEHNNNSLAIQDVAPGGNRAVLTLSSGQRIELDSAHLGAISRQGNATVVKVSAGQIAYQQKRNSPLEATLNNLETPPAGQFQVTLPDGTQVWLNNSSRLTYPTAFAGKERQVELSGEAFFQVANDPKTPFHVHVRSVDVAVLGTSFNINSYLDEPAITTTLVDGAVSLSQRGQSIKLRPGEQLRVDGQGNAKKLSVNVDPIIAWKNGFFTFDETTDFSSAMRQLARWYNVSVEYNGPVPASVFYGTIDRQATLAQILKIFESKEYKIELVGKKLIVTSGEVQQGN